MTTRTVRLSMFRATAAIPCDALVWRRSEWTPCLANAVLRVDDLPRVNLCRAHALRANALELPDDLRTGEDR